MLPIADRFSGSEVVVLAEISEVTRKRFNDISESVSMRVRVERSFKGSAPDDFYMAFLVFPQTFEQHLRKPVGDGRYFLFLNHKQVTDGTGVTGEALVLFEPRPFAFLPYGAEALKEIQSLTGAAGENQ
jgi:hypothetical protein